MDRRDVLKGAVATVAVALVSGNRIALAANRQWPGVVYTVEAQGKWNGKAGSHAPQITVKGNQVTITNKHPMTEAHFIVRHTLVLEDGTVVGEKTFTPKDAVAESTHTLPDGYKGVYYATSFCNMHDFWLTQSA